MKLSDIKLHTRGAEVAAWQRFLKLKGFYGGPISGDFDSQTRDGTIKYQERHHIGENGAIGPETVKQARSDGFFVPLDRPDGKYFSEQSGVTLSYEVSSMLKPVAYEYYLWTGNKLVMHSGTRTPHGQAKAMYDNLRKGEDLRRVYGREVQPALSEILHAYEEARKSGKEDPVEAMTRVIEEQVRRTPPVYISMHLIGEAVDVWDSSGRMSSNQINLAVSLALAHRAQRAFGEPHSNPTHVHIQLR